jgi:hypothetical protein
MTLKKENNQWKGRTTLKLGPKNRLGNTLKYSKSENKSLLHTIIV